MAPLKKATIRRVSIALLVPGIAGMFWAGTIRASYLDTLPKRPLPEQLRTVPRNIGGTVIYQTEDESALLTRVDIASGSIFLVGAFLGIVYLRRWGMRRMLENDEDEALAEEGR
jgi:hypothetical protein